MIPPGRTRTMGALLCAMLLSLVPAAWSHRYPHSTKFEIYRSVFDHAIEVKVEKLIIHHENSQARLCTNLTPIALKKEPQEWQLVEDRKVMVFSAYYEARVQANGPSVRIVGAGWQEQFNTIGQLYCQLWYDERNYAVSVPAKYDVIYPSILHHESWCSHFIICPLPVSTLGVPRAVSVTPEPCIKPQTQLLVFNREPVTKTDTHALCVAPLYNYFSNWEAIAENFELHKLMGYSEIAIFNFSTHPTTDKLLHGYVNDPQENVSVIRWPWPDVDCNVFGQRAAINDCLYRLGHKHRYVTITDLDEFLVPRMTSTLPELMKMIRTPKMGAFLFQHAYFRRNTSTEEPYLISQSSFWRTDEVTPPGKIRCKAMYDVAKVIKIDLHYAYTMMPDAEEYILPPHEGMLHHYRKDPMENFRRFPDKYTFIEDTYMTKYKMKLVSAFNRRVKILKTPT